MYKAHMVELYVTKKQANYLMQCAGASRFVYNNLLSYSKSFDKLPSKQELRNKIKELRKQHEWLEALSAQIAYITFLDLMNAYDRFFKKLGGAPKFKKKGVRDSFSFRTREKFKIENRKFRFEKMPKELGSFKLREKPRFDGNIISFTISRVGTKWFVSFMIDIDTANTNINTVNTDDHIVEAKAKQDNVIIGVDLGLKELAVLSDGTVFPNSKPLQRKERKLRKLNKKLARQYKRGVKTLEQSNNYYKTKHKLSKLHMHTTFKRKAISHKLTSHLVKNADIIVIEDLKVSNMLKNKYLSKSISDVSWYEIRRQLEYKCKWHGKELIIADQLFPSSKTCSNCGHIKKKLKLSTRTYICEECGFKIDRDLNASINLANLAKVATHSSDTINDCGEHISSVKQ